MATGARPKVLIVDDNVDLTELLVAAISRLGRFEVLGAPDGASGLQCYFDFRPDCVIIDVMMPELDGYQLIHALRGDPASATTPLIILSALAQENDQRAGFLSGADRYLVKPVTPQALVASIQEVLAAGRIVRVGESLGELLGD